MEVCEVDVGGKIRQTTAILKREKEASKREFFLNLRVGNPKYLYSRPRMPRGPGYHLPLYQSEFSPSLSLPIHPTIVWHPERKRAKASQSMSSVCGLSRKNRFMLVSKHAALTPNFRLNTVPQRTHHTPFFLYLSLSFSIMRKILCGVGPACERNKFLQ